MIPWARAALRRLADPLHEPCPALGVRRLEGVVVALDPRPDDEVGAELAGEVGRLERPLERLLADRGIGRDEAALPKARIEMEPGADGVDPVVAEHAPHLVQVRRRELLGVVELVVVDQPLESLDRAGDALDGRLARELGLVAAGHETRRHRPERPDPEARPHSRTASPDSAEA